MSRLSSFVESGTLLVKDESVEDTCLDLINYAVLFYSYIQSVKEEKKNQLSSHALPSVSYQMENGKIYTTNVLNDSPNCAKTSK
jgi:hypothetical protein